MVKITRFETYFLETGVKALVTETGQQLPPSYICLYNMISSNAILNKMLIANYIFSPVGAENQ